MNATVLHVLPRAPGTLDGVGDYALQLARGLRDEHAIDSVFLARETGESSSIEGFDVLSLQNPARAFEAAKSCDAIVLHYVNYGFQKRGVPVTFVSLIKSLHHECGGALLVIFHELFAIGPVWRSEFWLGPLQKKLAADLARVADARMISCESMRSHVEKLSGLSALVQPVTSTWGEPQLDATQLRARDPHCWIICGGTALVERSLRSFLKFANSIAVTPRKLYVVGGTANPNVPRLLQPQTELSIEYHPNISPAAAADFFKAASFAWLDYFSSPNVPADVLLKSSTFIGLSAHGIVTVLPQMRGDIAIRDDVFPAAFPVAHLPGEGSADIGYRGYDWYQRHASRAVLARCVAEQLQLA